MLTVAALILSSTFAGSHADPLGPHTATIGVRLATLPGMPLPAALVIVGTRLDVPDVPTIGLGVAIGRDDIPADFDAATQGRLTALVVARAIDASRVNAWEALVPEGKPGRDVPAVIASVGR